MKTEYNETLVAKATSIMQKLADDLYASMSLNDIGRLILREWRPINYAAKPYAEALRDMQNGQYGLDDAKSIILYFLSNASTWRGPLARAVKAELKARAGVK